MSEFDTLIRVTKAVSDPGRVKILKMLAQREMCACEIVAAMNLAQPTVSKHLKQLTDAGLIQARRDGAWMHFRLTTKADLPTAADAPAPIQLAMLELIGQHLNDDPSITRICAQIFTLTPEQLNCRKGQ